MVHAPYRKSERPAGHSRSVFSPRRVQPTISKHPIMTHHQYDGHVHSLPLSGKSAQKYTRRKYPSTLVGYSLTCPPRIPHQAVAPIVASPAACSSENEGHGQAGGTWYLGLLDGLPRAADTTACDESRIPTCERSTRVRASPFPCAARNSRRTGCHPARVNGLPDSGQNRRHLYTPLLKFSKGSHDFL